MSPLRAQRNLLIRNFLRRKNGKFQKKIIVAKKKNRISGVLRDLVVEFDYALDAFEGP